MPRFIGKILADGQVPATKTVLYTGPVKTNTYVKFFSLYNTSGAPVNTTIYVRSGPTSRIINYGALAATTGYNIVTREEGLVIGAGDVIEAMAATTDVIDYVISGVVEDWNEMDE